ncbi:hypothetical protein LSH36_584g01035 [Paralvinella palmiformis]|uniref:Sulfatase N-terminal domain-containing protein n=1 Tax=Paralvinella palmiformis TaxID=53620 RepID=A0AAD9J5F5_9ANNE|nr:hypothetical protein LSH36_584g01035 [Paralvinella palmiformis]
MGVDWSHIPETSINYHQAGPNMEPTRKEKKRTPKKYVEKGSPDRYRGQTDSIIDLSAPGRHFPSPAQAEKSSLRNRIFAGQRCQYTDKIGAVSRQRSQFTCQVLNILTTLNTMGSVNYWIVILLVLAKMECLAAERKNVLFLVSDDMRPEINVYLNTHVPGYVHPKMHTPNLDKLASRSLLLKKAYVQMAVCSPSRTSLLTGRRPDTTKVHDLTHYWRNVAGNFTTIPQYFKNHGYASIGMGKIFHPNRPSGYDDPISWTAKYFRPNGSYWQSRVHGTWLAADDEEEQRHPLMDTQTAQQAIKTLHRLAPKVLRGEHNFFLAVGFHKPHLPFVFPARFLKYYPIDAVRLPANSYAPVGMPEVAWSNFDELRNYPDISTKYGYGAINTTLPDAKVKELRRAYYAALSYVDYLIGLILVELETLGLDKSTVVSFWGDHGWQLGEHGEWCKHTNFELSTHAPMMVRIPGLTDAGLVTEQLTEFVDLFPSLAEAAGLPPVPLCPEQSGNVTTCTEGVSFLPLIKDPGRTWKSGAFSQYPRMFVDGDIAMGYRLRTTRYSYTEWRYYDDLRFTPFWNRHPHAIELYDHAIDPEENVNKATDKYYAVVIKQLAKSLKRGWRNALPPHLI